MAGRWAAAAILLVMVLIVGVFLWAVFRPPPAPAADGTAGPPVTGEMRFARAGGSWRLAARAVPAAGRAVAVTVSATDLQGQPLASAAPPAAALRMLDMAMAPERMALVRDGAGSWRGSTTLSMAGRWILEVELNGERLNLVFEAGAR